jgi:hypothetical protein
MKYLFLLMMIVSCASKKPVQKTVVKEFPASSKDRALKILETRQRYLKLLFENNEMPVDGEKKWTSQCVSENKVGNPEEIGDSLLLISELYLDSSLKEGFCSDKFYVRKFTAIYIYCKDQKKVLDIRFPYVENPKPDQRNLCQ